MRRRGRSPRALTALTEGAARNHSRNSVAALGRRHAVAAVVKTISAGTRARSPRASSPAACFRRC
ncbi:hypothetical protein [Lysobacter gummosus]|uniref:hypothetical protein n=1 Tax=Lysobacter gummosus TaxID=262324 RepID=UPI00363DFFAC